MEDDDNLKTYKLQIKTQRQIRVFEIREQIGFPGTPRMGRVWSVHLDNKAIDSRLTFKRAKQSVMAYLKARGEEVIETTVVQVKKD